LGIKQKAIKTHELKTIQPYFDECKKGNKKFEFRKNDRNFEVGDEVLLREYDPETDTYSGNAMRAKITYILNEFGGLGSGYCVLSLEFLTMRIKDREYFMMEY
jgi:hypothetical protein